MIDDYVRQLEKIRDTQHRLMFNVVLVSGAVFGSVGFFLGFLMGVGQ